MAKASIHIEPIKSSSEIHNKRLKDFDYIRKDLSEKNEKWEERSISEVRREVEEKYLRNVGQKMQKKATPIREGVVLLKPEHTMADLFRLKEKLYQKLGIKTFQMYIHKDEGHWKGEEKLKQWVPNLHAHMIFDWTDDKGKSLKLDRKQMSLIQDIVSETLEMERGQRATVTGRKHLNPLEYKTKVMLDKIIEIEKKEKDLKKQLEDTQSEKEILKKDLQKLNEKYDEKHADFQRFFQSDINVSLFKKSVSNGFFGGKKEVINEEEIKKLIQNFSFSTENWKNEEKLKKQYLREKLAIIEREERQKQEAKRKQEEEAYRLWKLESITINAVTEATIQGKLYNIAGIKEVFQTLSKYIPKDYWSEEEIDKAIKKELGNRGINLQSEQQEQEEELPRIRIRR